METEKIHYLDENELKKVAEMIELLSMLGLKKIYKKNIAIVAQEIVSNEYFKSEIDSAASDCFSGVRLENGNMNVYNSTGIPSTVIRFSSSNNCLLIEGFKNNSPTIKTTLLGKDGELFYDSEIKRTIVEDGIKVEETIKRFVRNDGKCVYITKSVHNEHGQAKVMK